MNAAGEPGTGLDAPRSHLLLPHFSVGEDELCCASFLRRNMLGLLPARGGCSYVDDRL